MSNIEKRIDAVCTYLLSEDPAERDKARSRLLELMSCKYAPEDPEAIVRRLFLEIGAPDHLMGHELAIQGVLLVVESRMYIDNITFGLYPTLAAKNDTTASRVERAIRHLIEVIWLRCDNETLFKYFGNTVSADKGKPTNGEFISRCANIVKLRMRGIA